ncbi:MAG: hypothetical protein ACRCX4_03335, partial [Bacteroidales bacterium]
IDPTGEVFFSSNFSWGGPQLITGDADSYTELVKGLIISENIPATEARKTVITLTYTRNGIEESATIPFEGNVERNKLYQYQIKITGLKIEIENIVVLPWNEAATDVTVPGVEFSFSQVEVPYSYASENQVYFTTKNINPAAIQLMYRTTTSGGAINDRSRFNQDKTKLTVTHFDQTSRIAHGVISILRSGRTMDPDTLIVDLGGIKKNIIVRGVDIAGSNIYYDDLSQKLTFDDVPDKGSNSPNADFQGVFFRAGTLAAYGPPPEQNSSYTNRIKLMFHSMGATTFLPEHKTGALMKFDPDKGLGDICEYMTRRGWRPGNKKWRIPQTSEFYSEYLPSNVSAELTPPFSENGQARQSNGARIRNHFFPTSGSLNANHNFSVIDDDIYITTARINRERPRYVLNTLSGNNLTTAYVTKRTITTDTGERPMTGGYGYFYTVRCVVDDSPGEVTPLYVVSYDLSGGEAGNVTAATPEGIIVNQHVDAGGSVTLSKVILSSSEGLLHIGWSINGINYNFGETVDNISKDVIVKPR